MNDDLQLKDKDCPISGSPDTYYIDGCKEPFSKKAFQVIALLAYASILLIVVNVSVFLWLFCFCTHLFSFSFPSGSHWNIGLQASGLKLL
ncbi:unnamed protein product [Trichobilharzia regenti]|nr:unnamed protein product [Trichobilharzia regenti]